MKHARTMRRSAAPFLFWSAFIALLVMTAFVNPVLADNTEPATLRIAYTEFPPIEYQTEDGEPAGHFIDLTRKVVQEAGYKAEFIYLPIARIYLYLKNGTVDIWPGLSGVQALQGKVLESQAHAYLVQLSAWSLESTEPLTHFDQLDGKTVIVIAGYTYGRLLSWLESADRMHLTQAPNNRAALEMLKLKRGDYILDYRAPVNEILARPSDSRIVESEVRTRKSAWLYSSANPKAALLKDNLDDAYLRLVEKGTVPPSGDTGSNYVVPGFPVEDP